MNFGLEVRVGLFVVAATLLIAVISVAFGKLEIGSNKGYHVLFRINDASGLSSNTSVYFKGVKVGRVNSIALDGDTLLVTLNITNGYKIPNNVKFTVRQSGFVGEKFVDLILDNERPATTYLASGEVYDSQYSVVTMDQVLARVDNMSEQIAIFVSSLNKVFAQDNTTAALAETVQHIKSITENIDTLISSNDEKVSNIISHIENLTQSIDKLIAKNESNLDNSLYNIAELTTSLKSFSANLDNITKNNYDNIDKSIANIKDITDKLDSSMRDINSITKDLDEGKGTIGMLINDNQTKEDIQTVVTSVKSMLTKVENYKLFVTFGADYMFDVNDARGYAQLRLYTTPYRFYMLGVSNTPRLKPTRTQTHVSITPDVNSPWPTTPLSYSFTETSRKSSTLAFSLQYGHIFSKIFGVRVGIFDNTVGAAIDLYPLKNENLVFSAEAYDFGSFGKGFEVYTRALVRWHFLDNFFVQAGVEDILNNNKRVYTVGGGVRFADDDLKFLAGAAGSAAGAVK